MLLTAAALATDLDVPLQESISKYFPAVDLENRFWQEGHLGIEDGEKMHPLPLLTVAPELEGASDWINSQPLTMQQLRGKVVLVDFWTYSCINCLRTLPYLKKWYNTYKDKNFIIIGVHTPEFAFEKELKNVEKAVQRLQIPYPVVLDNDYKIWQAYENMYWPAHYLIDTHGMVRQVHFGEGGYVETENAIRELLGLSNLKEKEPAISHRPLTPETYLGYRRGASYPNAIKIQEDLASTYHYEGTLGTDEVALQGKWLVGPENIQSASEDSRLELNFEATRVYLVLGGKSSLPITVLLDGHPLPAKYYTSDMDDKGQIFIRDPRKYDIVNLHGDYGKHLLSLRIPKGISAYAFTFGDE
jgi:thiol-disulfide isomerase/thioredoxin